MAFLRPLPLLLLLLLPGWPGGEGWAMAGEPSIAREYELKAALLFNLVHFTRWRDGRREEELCVVGDDPFGPILGHLALLSAERWKEARPWRVRRLAAAGEGGRCRVLFIGEEGREPLGALLGHPALAGALTVGEGRAFAEAGGMVAFTLQQGRVRFVFNPAAMRRQQVSISSQVLSLGELVGEPFPGGEETP